MAKGFRQRVLAGKLEAPKIAENGTAGSVILKSFSHKILARVQTVNEELYPYVVFLPSEEKNKVLSAIFGSKAAVDLLKFSLEQGVAKSIYQKDLVSKLNFSNKTIIENLKTLTKLRVLDEAMEKNEKDGRIIWVKAYQLTDLGKWFALLMADEEQISETEKAEIMQNLFRIYVKMVKGLAEELHVNKKMFEDIFKEEMKA